MKAIVYKKYGEPEVLHIEDIDKPVPKDNELLIKVCAAEATKADCEMRSFEFPVKWFWLPLRIAMGVFRPSKHVLGGYFAGEVATVGKDVSTFKPGDHVFGACKLLLGAYAEYVCLPENYTIVLKPKNISFKEAAAVPLGALNAIHFMNRANIQVGEKILINGAGGSIGTFAVQIAKAIGAEVTAVDSAIKKDMLLQIGVDHFIDYKKEDFTRSADTYDVIFNMVAGYSYTKCIKRLKPHGRYLLGNPKLADMIRSVFTSQFTDKTAIFSFADETEAELVAIKEMIEAGALKPVLDNVYLPEQAALAHHRVETEQRVGAVVISMHDE